MKTYNLLTEILPNLDPAQLDYQQWVQVGMALKHEGYSVDDWEAWSLRDPARYHRGECLRKWNSFHGGGASPVTAGTIVEMARSYGWYPEYDGDTPLDWDGVIGSHDDYVIVQSQWVEDRELPQPDRWDPAQELIRYIDALFDADDIVGYVTGAWFNEEKQKWLPQKGAYRYTAGELIEKLSKHRDDIGAVIGDYKPEVGAWIRFNPLDGKDVKNENITNFRWALVESDSLDIERQYALIHKLELPARVVVHSGGKSLHAIVHIGAATYEQYRQRVDYLYKVCEKNGLKLDRQNCNPSRLSRMPGIMRNGKRQYIVAENIGQPDFETWQEWVEAENDELPDPENLADIWNDMPELAPPLIEGVLRQGHKMLIAGPSKAGKSFALIELCVALAEGRPWLGFSCAQGRVLYVNLELDSASCWHRIRDVYDAMGLQPTCTRNIDVWNLRGKSVPMDKLAPKLIRRAAKKGYLAVVIDPIYKVITGDENSADQMAAFCNQFDRICTELGCAVIYCHHHSKGLQGQKRSMDRASGSGVFARDPDAMLDLIELDVPDALRKAEGDRAALDVMHGYLDRYVDDWEETLSQDDMCSYPQTEKHCERLLSPELFTQMKAEGQAARERSEKRTAWRLDCTLREFPRFKPVDLWFDYPAHRLDAGGCLRDVDADGAQAPWEKAKKARQKQNKAANVGKAAELDSAIQSANMGEPPTVKQVAEYLELEERTIRTRISKSEKYYIDKNNGNVIKRKSSGNDLDS